MFLFKELYKKPKCKEYLCKNSCYKNKRDFLYLFYFVLLNQNWSELPFSEDIMNLNKKATKKYNLLNQMKNQASTC